MMLKSPATRRLSALAAACLMGVALPALPALAKEKTKTKPAAETAEAGDTAVDFEYTVSIPGIETVDSNVDDAVLVDILSGNLLDHAEALAGLTATSITVPEITVSFTGQQDGEDYTASVSFTDLVLEDVADGVAGSVSLAGTEMSSDEADFSFGTLSAANFDIGGVLGIYGIVGGPAGTELKTIYTYFSAEGGTLTSEEVDCTIGEVSGSEFKARPLQSSLFEFVALAESMEDDPEDVDPRMMATLMRMYADIFTAFETSEVSFGGMSCEGVDDEGRDMTFGIDGISMGAMTPGNYPAISMDGFEILVEGDGSMSLDNFTIKPMDLSGVIDTLQGVPDSVDDAWFEANYRRLIPAMEGFSLTGFDIDIPDPDNKRNRIAAKVGGFDVTLGNYQNGIPADSDISAQNIQFAVPENSGDETIEQLRGLGVTDIDAGFRIATTWDEATSTIALEEISLTDPSLATVTLAGTIANATAELFDPDADTSLAAAMAIAVQSVNLDVVDAGLTDVMLGAIAAEQGGDIEQLRPLYADLAKGTTISLLAGVADAAKLGDAISTFIAGNARTLQIGLVAKEEPGLSILDFIAAETDPTSILRKVNISATAK